MLNGTGQPGQATSVAAALKAAGFSINGTANATSYGYTLSSITYPSGAQAAAETLAAHISGAYRLALDPSLPSGVVDLVVGTDFEGVRS